MSDDYGQNYQWRMGSGNSVFGGGEWTRIRKVSVANVPGDTVSILPLGRVRKMAAPVERVMYLNGQSRITITDKQRIG